MSMLPAREGQAEVIEPVIERHTSDADTVIAHVGEIGQPETTRWMIRADDSVIARSNSLLWRQKFPDRIGVDPESETWKIGTVL